MHNVDDILAALPTAVCVTDADGRITFVNTAAVQLLGVGPLVGQSVFAGNWKLYSADGRPLPHDQGPLARVVTQRSAVAGVETIVERPDGTRARFLTSSTPSTPWSRSPTDAATPRRRRGLRPSSNSPAMRSWLPT